MEHLIYDESWEFRGCHLAFLLVVPSFPVRLVAKLNLFLLQSVIQPSVHLNGRVNTGSWLHASSNASYGLSVAEFEVPERSVKTLSSVPRGMGSAS